MGADLCMALIAHRTGVKIDREAAVRYVENLQPSDLTESKAESDYTFEDIVFDETLGFDGDPNVLTDVKTTLIECLDSVIGCLNARDVTMYRICGFDCYFTGGVTWGDDPCESYSDFNRLLSCGILGEKVMQAAGFEWPPTGPDTFHIQEEASLSDV